MHDIKQIMHEESSNAPLPAAFCWTRMGDESGEALSRILRRKEVERLSAGGAFLWGIGNGLGQGVNELVLRHKEPTVLFSPIRSMAALRDRAPTSVVLWLDYLRSNGEVVSLPASAFVTSRGTTAGGMLKLAHYALFCRSEEPLGSTNFGTLKFHELRNLVTQKPVGFSQVTAVVSRQTSVERSELAYSVVVSARLESPFFARLASPIVLDGADLELVDMIAESGDPGLWLREIVRLKGHYRTKMRRDAAQLPLFADIDPSLKRPHRAS